MVTLRRFVVFFLCGVAGFFIIMALASLLVISDIQKEMENRIGLTLEQQTAILLSGLDLEIALNFTEDELNEFSYDNGTVVIHPVFTQTAYKSGGFYDYFTGVCDESCLTIEVDQDWNHKRYTSSKNALRVFEALNWDIIDDLAIHRDPGKLSSFDKIIMLHSEYVTRDMFDAITSHPNVVYLYPNALYAEVEYDEEANTITLIRGHGYPSLDIANGFDWQYDNTHPYEYDTDCEGWQFHEINNGYMLYCYPEHIILTDRKLLREIKDL